MKALTVITYLIYIVLWEALVIGGSAYVIFWLNKSPWWILLGIFLSGCSMSPAKWRQLWDTTKTTETNE